MRGKIIITVSLILLVVALIAAKSVRQAKSDQLQNPYSDVVSVIAVQTRAEPFARILAESGTLTGVRESVIAAETGGQVTRFMVEVGDRVSAGSPILKLDDELYQLEAERAKINYEKTRMDFERIERLHNENGASDSEFEGARLAAKGAEVAFKMAEKTYNDATIKAPFSGVVSAKFTEVGQMIQPGVPVVQLIDQSSMKLVIQVPEEAIRFIEVNAPATTVIDAAGMTVEGKVVSVGSKSNSGARTYPVEIKIPGNPALRSGMFARATIEAGTIPEAIVVPRVALLPDGGRTVVFLVRNGAAEKKVVNILGLKGDLVAVEGLAPGDTVVTTGNQGLNHGVALSVTLTEAVLQ